MCVCVRVCVYMLSVCVRVCVCTCECTGGGKGGAMGLQPCLILRVLHRIIIFDYRKIVFFG